jgi:peroxiredoxin
VEIFMPTLLSPGDVFPAVALTTPGGETADLAAGLRGRYGVVLFNRGSWCPYCNAQLRAFQRAAGDLDAVGAETVSLSVDDEEATRTMIEKNKLGFRVGYGADAGAVSAATGAFVNAEPLFLQSTGFVLDPEGRVIVSVYSSGAIGRLVPEDVVGMIRYVRGRAEGA